MEPAFRASMNWLHTWAGVILGDLLFAIFWMGSLSVFDREIDRWMMPATRLAVPQQVVSFDVLHHHYQAAVEARSPTWFAALPSEREPVSRVVYRDGSGVVRLVLDPVTGAPLPEPGTWGATQFIYPFHYMLHIRFGQIGTWLVGFAGMAMLALCVSGVAVHRKIFADFFTFRPKKQPGRLILDLHNVAGVLGLPFHFTMALSGLIVLYAIYFPGVLDMAYPGDRQAFGREAFDAFDRPRANRMGHTASFDAMALEARRAWNGDLPRAIFVRHPGDAAAYARITRNNDSNVVNLVDVASFDVATGRLLHQRSGTSPILTAQRFVSGLHLIQFRHWSLRWLYFGLGLTGCVLIATGYLFWLESRRRKHAQLGLRGVRIVEILAIGTTAGIVTATLSFFIINRLLPPGAAALGQERAALEVWTFYLVWLATFAHAGLRPGRAWMEQCSVVAGLAMVAVLLNWITTGDHLARSLTHRHLWPVAGMDLLLLTGAGLAFLTARRLKQRQSRVNCSMARR